MGPVEIILIVVVVALLFGARKLPEIGKGLGQGIKEFRGAAKDDGAPVTVSKPEDRS
ncbi:twin-arginine translocase TatA/TatE family subunit [Deinococcus sp.]|uniref:twin-arginine translocase TatA/TatE family subunit n=1 Tax=Deinococcus sp. TaxID=47478 RepID=UPI003CC661D0